MITRAMIADAANRAGRASRISGAPVLSADSDLATVLAWAAWCDGNSVWAFPSCDGDTEESSACGECQVCQPITLGAAWAVVATMVRDDLTRPRFLCSQCAGRAECRCLSCERPYCDRCWELHGHANDDDILCEGEEVR
jgi:hypothetical protein